MNSIGYTTSDSLLYEGNTTENSWHNTNIGVNTEKCYTNVYESLEQKESESNMSLVGLFKCDNGIVGIGDYKSTRKNNSFFKEDDNRYVKKVFKNDNFILVTYGTNQIIKGNKIINLEDVLEKVVAFSSDVDNFKINFMAEISGISTNYNFLFGEKIGSEYILGSMVISGISFSKTYNFNFNLYGGEEKYYNNMASLSIDFTKDVKIVAQKLEKALISLIDFYSVEDVYQTVGTNDKGKVLVEIFK